MIKINQNPFGIPQGSPISSVLSNIYMMDFDITCKNLLQKYDGLYMRFCDDSIFVFPYTKEAEAKKLFDIISNYVKSVPNLELSPQKTKAYYYREGMVQNLSSAIGSDNRAQMIDYLGFTFDGTCIRIRERTTGKYYYRLYRSV